MKECAQDTDLDIGRLRTGIDITHNRKLKDIQTDSFHTRCREKLVSGEYNPIQYLYSIANSIQPDTNLTGIMNEEYQSDPSSDVDDDEINNRLTVVCAYCAEKQP